MNFDELKSIIFMFISEAVVIISTMLEVLLVIRIILSYFKSLIFIIYYIFILILPMNNRILMYIHHSNDQLKYNLIYNIHMNFFI